MLYVYSSTVRYPSTTCTCNSLVWPFCRYEMLVGYTPFYFQGMTKSELFRAILNAKVFPPKDASKPAMSLLSGLLKRNPATRLGSLAGGENDILEHPWFDPIDRDELFLKEIQPPFVPEIKDPFDVSCFGDWGHLDDKTEKTFPKLTEEQANIYKSF